MLALSSSQFDPLATSFSLDFADVAIFQYAIVGRLVRAACAAMGGPMSQDSTSSSPVCTAVGDTKDFAARTELLPIQTLTLTDRQFLTGDRNGKAATIAGQLRIAQG